MIISAVISHHFRNNISVLLIILAIFCCGLIYQNLNSWKTLKYPFADEKVKDVFIYGKVEDCDLFDSEKISFIAQIDSIKKGNQSIIVNREAKIFIFDDDKLKLASKYDRIYIDKSFTLKGRIKKPNTAGNYGEFDYYDYLRKEGITFLGTAYDANNLSLDFKQIDSYSNFFFILRKKIAASIDQFHNRETAALLKGLLLADRSQISDNVLDNFIKSGTIHLLAVSGLHVAFIMMIFLFIFGRFDISTRNILTILGLIFFMLLTNSRPPVVRATIMASVFIISFLSNRSTNSYNSLSLAAFIILLLNPNELFMPGFQLSFLAVLSIVTIHPMFKELIEEKLQEKPVLKKIILFVLLTVSAQVGTIPIVILYFNKLSIISIFSNLIVVPLVACIVSIGIFTLVIGTISGWAAQIYAITNEKINDFVFYLTKTFAGQKFSYLEIFQLTYLESILIYLFIIAFLIWMFVFKNKLAKIILSILIFINILVFGAINKKILDDEKLSIISINVGQGDAFLLKFPNGKTALIDAGNATRYLDCGERIIYPLLKRLGVKKLNWLFISHVDADHYKGSEYLLEKIKIDTVYKPTLKFKVEKDKRYTELIEEKDIPVKGYSQKILRIGNARIYLLSSTDFYNFNKNDLNNRSGVLKVVYGENEFLFTGDLERKIEVLLSNYYDSFLNSDVLKVAHHGSKHGSSSIFIESVKPDYALISCGRNNRYGHPSKQVIKRLQDNKVKVFRTDQSGMVILESDGNSIKEIDW